MSTRTEKISAKSERLVDAAIEHGANAHWERDQGTGSAVNTAIRNADEAKRALNRHIARLEVKEKLALENGMALAKAHTAHADSWQKFIAFIGNGENSRGAFPTNLTELNDDVVEFTKFGGL